MQPADLLTALGLAFLIEGAMYALAPRGMQRLMGILSQLPESQVRGLGLVAALLGFLIVGVMRA